MKIILIILTLLISGCMKVEEGEQVWLNVGDKFDYDNMRIRVTEVICLSKSQGSSEHLIILRKFEERITKSYRIVVSDDSIVVKVVYK